MFSFFSRSRTRKTDVNANNVRSSNHQPQTILSPLLLLPLAPPHNPTPDTAIGHSLNASPNEIGIGNGIVKMGKNKTRLEFAADVDAADANLVRVVNGGSANETSQATLHAAEDVPIQDGRLSPSILSMSNVKPAGHGTVAISPRIPTPNASRRNSTVTPTPPESPHTVSDVNGDCNGFSDAIGTPKGYGYSYADERSAKRHLEAKFQCQLNDLSNELATRDAETNKLRFQMDELQRDVFAKSAGMDRLQAELQAAHKESEHVKQRIKVLEHDVHEYRERNGHLSEEVARKAETLTTSERNAKAKLLDLESVILELRTKIRQLEEQIAQLQNEKSALVAQHLSILQERNKEKCRVEQQLEEAIKQKNIVQGKWQAEFEKLRTVSLLKEQQLLDDFESSLREVHKSCKLRLDERQKTVEVRLRDAYRDAEVKMSIAQEMMDEVKHLKQCQNVVETLRDKTEEQQRVMRDMEDTQVEMKSNEEALRTEVNKLRRLIELEKENAQHMQRTHRQELMDKERRLQNTLQEKKTEIAEYWEERLLHEIGRLKWELEQLYLEEKQSAIEELKSRKEDEFDMAKKNWERKIGECFAEIKELKNTLQEKEAYYQNELVMQQTKSDREIFEFRRIMDKIDLAHHDRFEKLSLEHEIELEKLSTHHHDKMMEMEMSHKNQTSTLRASLILQRDQLEKDAQHQVNDLSAQHRAQLDTQWVNLVHQKSEAIKLLEQDYMIRIQTMEDQFHNLKKSHEEREIELLKTIDGLKSDVRSKDNVIDEMQSNVDTLEAGVQVLNQEIAQQNEQLMKNRRDADQTIRGLQEVLVKLQALVDQERDEFQSKLTHQQKQSQQQVDHLQKKIATLTKLFDEVRSRHECRESRQEDLDVIADLRQMIAEQEKDMTCINEEKRYYQMQMLKLQRENEASLEDPDDEYVDTEEFQTVSSNYTVTFPTEADEPVVELQKPINTRSKLSMASVNFAIPPTIPECDDCDEEP